MSAHALLEVHELSVQAGAAVLLQPLSFALNSGECLVIVGESGAGKSLLAQAIMGQLPPPLTAQGRVQVGGMGSPANEPHWLQRLWGRALALLPQEPALALSPLRTTYQQLNEVFRLVAGLPALEAHSTTQTVLANTGLTHAATAYPWQLSGGMAQRAVTAMALAGGARAIMADEPTKGLDVAWRQVFADTLLEALRGGACAVVITHDMQLAQQLGGQLMVMQQGRVVEQGHTRQVLAAPAHPFTQALVQASPERWDALPIPAVPDAPAFPGNSEPLLSLSGVSKRWTDRPSLFTDMSLEVHAGERLALTGPSGCGKSTLGQIMLGLVKPDSGQVNRHPALHAHAFQKLYQDPVKSFPPKQTLHAHLLAVTKLHRVHWQTVTAWMDRLQLSEQVLARPASQVSGGELQRVALLRTLLAKPAFVFADEPTSRLDPITQRHTVALLCEVLSDSQAALVLVTHDPALARAVSKRFISLGEC
jgi:peptide/nickel transport system ATP-binding protein